MSAARVIVALYPPAVRQRWGDELAGAVADGGVRGWPDAVGGAIRLWLHPSDWPETTAGQTRRVLAVALFAVAAAAMLLLRADQPAGAPVAAGLWFAPLAAGALLAAPRPRRPGLRRLGAEGVRCMAAPVVAVAGIFALARCGVAEHATGVIEAALVAYYWATLAFFALRACTLVARALPVCVVPSTRQLRTALLLVGAGAAVAAGEGALAGALAVTGALGVLAAVSLRAGLNLGR